MKPVAYIYPILAFLAGTGPNGTSPPWIVDGTYELKHPYGLRAPLPLAPMLAAMKRDKKVRAGKLRFVLLQGVGTAVTADNVPEDRAIAAFVAGGAVA